jgi:hypothetical protein
VVVRAFISDLGQENQRVFPMKLGDSKSQAIGQSVFTCLRLRYKNPNQDTAYWLSVYIYASQARLPGTQKNRHHGDRTLPDTQVTGVMETALA